MSDDAILCLVSLFFVATVEPALITSGHISQNCCRKARAFWHTFHYPSQGQHRLLQHTLFSSKMCWNFLVLVAALIILMSVDSVSAVLVQMLQDRSVMCAFPSLKYFTQCHVECTHPDVCIDTNEVDWQMCSEIVLLHQKCNHIMVVQWIIFDSQFVAVVSFYILVQVRCASISGWRQDDTTSRIIPSLRC
jgi:hypothetical protein